MDSTSKILIGIGILVIMAGIVWHMTDGSISLGKLPGDIRIESENTRFYFPIMTSLIVSAILSLFIYIFKK